MSRAMVEFERELIRECVTAGIQAARKRGARLERPRTHADPAKVKVMRAAGLSWRGIGVDRGATEAPS